MARLSLRTEVSDDRAAAVHRAAGGSRHEFEMVTKTEPTGPKSGMNDTNDHGDKTLSVDAARRPSR
jgi:hypothetical protein